MCQACLPIEVFSQDPVIDRKKKALLVDNNHDRDHHDIKVFKHHMVINNYIFSMARSIKSLSGQDTEPFAYKYIHIHNYINNNNNK